MQRVCGGVVAIYGRRIDCVGVEEKELGFVVSSSEGNPLTKCLSYVIYIYMQEVGNASSSMVFLITMQRSATADTAGRERTLRTHTKGRENLKNF